MWPLPRLHQQQLRQNLTSFRQNSHYAIKLHVPLPIPVPVRLACHAIRQYGSDHNGDVAHVSELHVKYPDQYDKHGAPYTERPNPWGVPVSQY